MPRLTEIAPGVLVATAAYATTTTTTVVIAAGGGCLVIDPAVPSPTWPDWPPSWPRPGCGRRLALPPTRTGITSCGAVA